jgi:hypothetical protein
MAVGWILLVLIFVALVVFVKATNIGQNVWSYVLVGAALFFVFTVIYVGAVSEPTFNSFDGFVSFGKVYLSWLGAFFGNFAEITGHAVNLDWSISNSTIGR